MIKKFLPNKAFALAIPLFLFCSLGTLYAGGSNYSTRSEEYCLESRNGRCIMRCLEEYNGECSVIKCLLPGMPDPTMDFSFSHSCALEGGYGSFHSSSAEGFRNMCINTNEEIDSLEAEVNSLVDELEEAVDALAGQFEDEAERLVSCQQENVGRRNKLNSICRMTRDYECGDGMDPADQTVCAIRKVVGCRNPLRLDLSSARTAISTLSPAANGSLTKVINRVP